MILVFLMNMISIMGKTDLRIFTCFHLKQIELQNRITVQYKHTYTCIHKYMYVYIHKYMYLHSRNVSISLNFFFFHWTFNTRYLGEIQIPFRKVDLPLKIRTAEAPSFSFSPSFVNISTTVKMWVTHNLHLLSFRESLTLYLYKSSVYLTTRFWHNFFVSGNALLIAHGGIGKKRQRIYIMTTWLRN